MKALSLSVVASIIIQVANVVSGVLVARMLGAEGRGELAAIMLWPAIIITVGRLGINESITYVAAAGKTSLQRIHATSMVLMVGLGAVMMIAGYVLYPQLFGGFREEVLPVARLFLLLYVPLFLTTVFQQSLFRGALLLTEWNILRTVIHVAFAAGIVAVWWLGHPTVLAAALAMVVANAVIVLMGIGFLLRRQWLLGRPDMTIGRHLLSYGVRVHFGELSQFLGEKMGEALISLMLAAIDLGLYVVANTIARGSTLLAETLQLVALPRLTAEPLEARRAAMFGSYMKGMLILTIPGSLVLAAITQLVLRFLFGEEFLDASTVVYVLILANIPFSGKLVYTAAFLAYDRAMLFGKAEAMGVAVLAVSLVVLLPVAGILGAAVAVLVTNCISFALLAWWARQHMGLSFRTVFLPSRADVDLVYGAILRRA